VYYGEPNLGGLTLKIFAGSDHGGLSLKKHLLKRLQEWGHEVVDVGTYSFESCDYPDYAHAVAEKVLAEPEAKGLLVCGTGIGISVAANRHPGIRAALCHCSVEAKLAREHNNANILALGGRIIGDILAEEILQMFLNSEFTGGRHSRRVEKIEYSENQ